MPRLLADYLEIMHHARVIWKHHIARISIGGDLAVHD